MILLQIKTAGAYNKYQMVVCGLWVTGWALGCMKQKPVVCTRLYPSKDL